ncbi:MAG: AIR synthase-related protein, partial [Acidobacteriota bacterium]
MIVEHFFRSPGLPESWRTALANKVATRVSPDVRDIRTEFCFNIQLTGGLSEPHFDTLRWLLAETFQPENFGRHSFLQSKEGQIIEVGPRLSFSTAWSTNAVSICHACGLDSVMRIERSRRFQLLSPAPLTPEQHQAFLTLIHDRMTERPYETPLKSFEHGAEPAPVQTIPVLEKGRVALEELNDAMGLAFDDWDLDFYTNLFREKIGRNPTTVECFDVAQSNSEHSRHWFFGGRLVIDGIEQPRHLMAMVREPLQANPNNSVIAFRDNSSSIRGHRVQSLIPSEPGAPGPMTPSDLNLDLTLTAETHNFPSGVAPFPGAETGTGGRIRDGHATGRASLIIAGTAAYCVGNLHIPGYALPWEDGAFLYPDTLASPLDIEIQASNGASDYGNKFGEPVITGFTRSFGARLPDGSRREWLKPIMFSGGIGQMDAGHAEKGKPRPEMLIIKIGGPAYRIGMGGGAASSMVQGENTADLDFNAVQRGDAEMEQKVNRVIRACSELGDRNPIISIHDQGAGGNCNVLKEIVEPEGAVIEIRDILVADQTLSVLEIWGAEYQENDALLIEEKDRELFSSLCEREQAPWSVVGGVTGDGRIVVHDAVDGSTPVDLFLEDVLGDMPKKVFELERRTLPLKPLHLPADLHVSAALDRVLRLLSVGSKRFLTTKVDRAVTGLVARQQCAGPLHLTVADVAVVAHSHFA